MAQAISVFPFPGSVQHPAPPPGEARLPILQGHEARRERLRAGAGLQATTTSNSPPGLALGRPKSYRAATDEAGMGQPQVSVLVVM